MNQIGINRYGLLPPAVKNILIINGLFFLAKYVLQARGVDLDALFGLHYMQASDFKIWQVITYMFMHGNFTHLFFNMFALWMFGSALENIWGAKKFLIYYFITGIGAAFIHYIVIFLQINHEIVLINNFLANMDQSSFAILNQTPSIHLRLAVSEILKSDNLNPMILDINQWGDVMAQAKDIYLNSYNIVGASGSIFGLLFAFGMLFPNALIFIYFLFPLKAKWFVIIYGAFELFYGVTGTNDGVAHFAHLGGMLFGFLIFLYWKRR
jgi:membrane associated rhomboid family serine protease